MSEPPAQDRAPSTTEEVGDPAAPRAPKRRERLSRERILTTALAMADAGGLEALTIRSLAAELGAKPMSVYYYAPSKDAILDGIVDLVFAEIYVPVVGSDWRIELSARARSARDVLRRHPWATPLLESRRSPGTATLGHHDAVLGTFREAGFSRPATAHAYALLDAYVYGHALQLASLPFEGPDGVGDVAEPIMDVMMTGAYPYMVEMATHHYLQPGYDFGAEFETGLALILDAIESLSVT